MNIPPHSHTISLEGAFRDLESQHHKTRVAAADALSDIHDLQTRTRAVDALIKAIDDNHPEVRAQVAASLGALGMESAVLPLCKMLRHSVPFVRQSAAIALGKLGFQSAFTAILDVFQNGPPDMRYQAATSLAEIDRMGAYQPLIDALPGSGKSRGESDGEVLGAIALALATIGVAEAADKLVPLLANDDGQVRFDIAYAIAQFGRSEGSEALEAQLTCKYNGWDAIEALELTGVVEKVASLLDKRFLDLRLKIRAAKAVYNKSTNEIARQNAQRVLIENTTARRLDHQGLAIEVCGAIGEDWCKEALEQARAHKRGQRFASEIDETLGRFKETANG